MKQVSKNINVSDVRNDPLGGMNKLINWVFTGKRPSIFRKLIGLVLHIELPVLQNPVRIAHPFGITINPGVQIGKNVTLFQCVTVGSKRHGRSAGVPTIEDNVVLYPNAVVVGGVVVGAGATIGPGAVVVTDIPAGATAVGNPARVILPFNER